MPSDTMSKIESRRVRIVNVEEVSMLAFFQAQQGEYDSLIAPQFTNLPRGYRVLAVHHNWSNGCFQFMVEHEEFSPVPFGETPPPTNAHIEMTRTVYINPSKERAHVHP